MKRFILLLILFSSSVAALSQDVITTISGKTLSVKVYKVDSTYVYFDDGQDLSINKIKRNDVKSINYASAVNSPGESKNGQINSLTIGILEGGGSLVGLDYEVLLSKKTGLQLGAGFVGFGAGLNFHFLPTIRSSYFSIQYWHQGFRNSYTQSLLGPNIVFRGKKLFSGQIGLGFLVDEGPARPEKIKDTSVMLTYALGLYFPY